MARFVESAVLQVIDRSSKPLNKIERSIRDVYAAADKLSRLPMRKAMTALEIPSAKGSSDALRQLGAVYTRLSGKAGGLAGQILSVNSALRSQAALARNASNALSGIRRPAIGDGTGRRRGGIARLYGEADTRYRTGDAIRKVQQAATAKSVVDISQARANVFRANFPTGESAELEKIAAETIQKYPAMSRGEALQTALETRQSVPSINAVRPIMDELARAFQASLSTGATRDGAATNLQYLTKAAGMTGRLMDAQGNVTQDSFRGLLDAFIKSKVLEGRAIDERRFFELLKYSRTTGQTMNDDALLRAALDASDMGGSSTGVAVNQLIKNFAGSATKSALEALFKVGIAEGQYEEGAGGKKVFRFTGIKDEEALRSNPWEFVRSKFLGPDGVLTKQNVDVNNAAAVAKFVNTLTSDRTAQGLLTNIITQLKEGDTKVANLSGARIAESDFRSEKTRNITVAWQELQGAIATALGDLSEKASSVTLPAINALTAGLTALSGAVTDSPGLAAVGALGASAGAFSAGRAISGSPAAKKIWNTINPVAGLNDAATNLSKSAAELSAAARALSTGGKGVAIADAAKSAVPAATGVAAASGAATSKTVAAQIAKEAKGGIASKLPAFARGLSGILAPLIIADIGEAIKGETTAQNFKPRFQYGFGDKDVDAAAYERSRRAQKEIEASPELRRATGFKTIGRDMTEATRASSEEFRAVFASGGRSITDGAARFETVVNSFPAKGAEFADSATPTLVAAGAQFGAAAAAQISQAALNFSINGPRVTNTGTNALGLR